MLNAEENVQCGRLEVHEHLSVKRLHMLEFLALAAQIDAFEPAHKFTEAPQLSIQQFVGDKQRRSTDGDLGRWNCQRGNRDELPVQSEA